jgi:hypothetical protein
MLRQRTRDTKIFNKVFAENMEYGFRRNCLGLRPTGLVLAAIGVVATIVLSIRVTRPSNPDYSPGDGRALYRWLH